jgi:hypothetical protein
MAEVTAAGRAFEHAIENLDRKRHERELPVVCELCRMDVRHRRHDLSRARSAQTGNRRSKKLTGVLANGSGDRLRRKPARAHFFQGQTSNTRPLGSSGRK